MTYEYDDPAHEADLRAERRRQLEGDISPEEAAEECAWSDENASPEEDDMVDFDDDDLDEWAATS